MAKAAAKKVAKTPARKKKELGFTWNHRAVRRRTKHAEWIEVTEVHYANGKPHAFAVRTGPPLAVTRSSIEKATDAEALASLRWTIEHMIKALEQPILDEETDFK